MKNKVLIKLVIPNLSEEFDVFIPVNERISKVKEMLLKCARDLSDSDLEAGKIYSLLDPDTGTIYDSRLAVRDTNIINTKKVILF